MKPRARALALVAGAVLAVAVGLVFLATDALRGLEHRTVDARYDQRDQAPRGDVVVVGIDDDTIDADGGFPLDRRSHARVIRQLTRAGAAVIAYDVQFTAPSKSAAADNALITAARAAAPRLVLATTEVEPGGKTAIFGGGPGLEFSRGTPAWSGGAKDEDGMSRHMPPPAKNGLDSFARVAAAKKLGHAVSQPGGAWIDFPGSRPRTLSLADVERGRFPAAAVRGKVVVIGATSPALQDVARTPLDDAMPGPELQAARIATALDDYPLRDAAGWIDVLLVVALGALGPLFALRFGGLVGLAVIAVATGLFVVGAQRAFNDGTVLTVVPPLTAAMTAFIVVSPFAVRDPHPLLNRLLDRLSPAHGNRRTRRLRTMLLIAAALLCSLGGLLLMATDALRRLDLSSIDMRFDVRGARPAPDSVVIVAIDDPTINDPKFTYPFTRKLHAKVIRALKQAGAAVVAYDVQFSQRSGDDAADNALIYAVRGRGARVVLAATAVSDTGKTNIFGGGFGLKFSRGVPSYSNFEKDPDGVTRHMLDGENGLTALPIAAAQLKVGHKIHAPPGNSAWIDFAGPPLTYKYLSFKDVAEGRLNPADVKGKIVVVGASASTLQDLRETSTTGQRSMPGPEVHANAITTALEGFPLHSGPGWLDPLLVVVLGVAAPFAAIRLRMLYAVPIGILAIFGLLVGAQIVFQQDVIVGVIYALVAGIGALLLTGAIHGMTVAFERANTRDAFARFVPESVVDQVLQDAEGVRLGGVRGEATVMFSDLRGFTSFAETLQPEQVIDALNRYLTAMSEAILDHGGTLVAYMGDGIMAVFGAPLQQDDHADRALAAARDMLTQLEGFNGWLRDQELHDGFKMGIGLNTGPVMSGNVGSERRLEYTALGDTTNTAARLEGMTKGTPYQLYVADSTREALRTPVGDLVEVGEFEVRGRKAKVTLWSLTDSEAGAGDGAPAADAEPVVARAEPPDEAQGNGVDPAVAADADADPAGHDGDPAGPGEREAQTGAVTGADGPGPDRDATDPRAAS
jgi:adenylate cyclase